MREDLGVAREFISAFCTFAGSFFLLLKFFLNFFSIYLLKLPPPHSRGVPYFQTIYHVETFFLPDIVDPIFEQLSMLA